MLMTQAIPKRKLIEVALPLEAINKASAREKSIRHGHPSTLHLWWARRPLAACRAVLFASLVDDPSSHPDTFPDEAAQDEERQRLFRLIEELVKWENTTNETVLDAARAEIMKSTDGNPPPVLDPFAGGGSIPLEAQRLGLEAHASDLNPVAVLINKALIEIPPKFAGRAPINPEYRSRAVKSGEWTGAKGLAEDVRYYGKWMRDEAERRIGHLYPKAKLPDGGEATVIAWLWARTVTCPNPACGTQMPLVRSFVLSSKKGKEAYAEPVVDNSQKPPQISFEVKSGTDAPEGDGAIGRKGAVCVACKTSVPITYVRSEGQAQRIETQLLAVIAEGNRGRVYLAPSQEHENIADEAQPTWKPDGEMPNNPRWFSPPIYGLKSFADLFTPRQLVALTTFSDLVQEARDKVLKDALETNLPEGEGLEAGGDEARGYADAVAVYLAFALDKSTDYWNTIASWANTGEFIRNCFARQAISMTWDFVEANPMSASSGNFLGAIDWVQKVIKATPASITANVKNADAALLRSSVQNVVISTDPPYYDNIGYADLSDFFYIWLRRSLAGAYPSIFSTLLVPKAQELVATPYRFGGSKKKAQEFFERGLGQAFVRMREAAHSDFPLTVYYAFKQSESEAIDDNGIGLTVASTGWETMLTGLMDAGFQITGTWPTRTERPGRSISQGTNALASSIVLVCRPRPDTAPTATRREFLTALRRELPQALRELQQGNIAPVDLAQASIGPGMAVFSRYAKVLESDGKPMPVRAALAIINQMLDEVLAEQEGEFGPDTRWALSWFEQYSMGEGPYGDAETLSKAKNTSVSGMVEAGILHSRSGKVRLLKRSELPADWDPLTDDDTNIWEATQHLVKRLEEGGEEKAAALLSALGSTAEIARDLAYRLYSLCERKKWAQEALAYNALVSVWPELTKLAANLPQPSTVSQPSAFGGQ